MIRLPTTSLKRLFSTTCSRWQYMQPVPGPKDRIIVAMSSGVDSSVAASLYKDHQNVIGIYMANWQKNAKCNEEEWNMVKQVAGQLDIPCERVNFEKEYWQQVFQPMIENYSEGLTPNPDLNCNRFIKFGLLLEYLNKKYADERYWLVTGHYSRILYDPESQEFDLFRAKYAPKDQSYYLSSIDKLAMSKILLPIGNLTKPRVREIALDLNLINKDKPDSMGLCFISQEEKKFDKFLNEYIQPQPGNIVTEDGKVWGKHNGLWYGTIGQKAKISMPQGDPQYKGTWFISEKRYDTNELVIVRGNDNPKLFKKIIQVGDFVWKADPNKVLGGDTSHLTIQYRSLQAPIAVKTIENDSQTLTLELTEPQRAMAPGQNIVIYEGDRVLGSGILTNTVC